VHRPCGSALCDWILFSLQGESCDYSVEQRLRYTCSTLPWLKKEDPNICWKAGTLKWKSTNRSPIYDDEYLFETQDFIVNMIETYEDLNDWDTLPEIEIAKAKISERFNEIYGSKKETKNIKEMIPKEYHRYLKVFDKEAATRIPQPTPFDHEIDLKEGAKTFKQSPYALNIGIIKGRGTNVTQGRSVLLPVFSSFLFLWPVNYLLWTLHSYTW